MTNPHDTVALALARHFARLTHHSIIRIAVARYTAASNRIAALAYQGVAVPALDMLNCPLDDIPSLAILASGDQTRVIDDLALSPRGSLGRELLVAGCRSSATLPLWAGDHFLGFLFVDADLPRAIDPAFAAALAGIAADIAPLLAEA